MPSRLAHQRQLTSGLQPRGIYPTPKAFSCFLFDRFFFLWNCCFMFPFLHFIFTFSFLSTFGVPFCIWKWFFCSGCTKLSRKMCEKVKKKLWKSRKVSGPGLYKRISLVQKAVKSGQTKKSKLFNFLLSFYLLFGIVWKLVKCDQM